MLAVFQRGYARAEPQWTVTSTVTAADVLELFDAIEGPVLGSGAVAEQLLCTRGTARRKLDTLEGRGRVASRMVGRTKVFWLTDRSGDLRDWMSHGEDRYLGRPIRRFRANR